MGRIDSGCTTLLRLQGRRGWLRKTARIGEDHQGGSIRYEQVRLNAKGDLSQFAAQLRQALIRLPNGHFHLALVVALLASVAIVVTNPIAHTGASSAPAFTTAQLEVGGAGAAVSPAQPVTFSVHERGLATLRTASAPTVGEALLEMGIELRAEDAVTPGAGETLSPGMHVYIDYATRIELAIGSERREVFTQAATVREALVALGLEPQAGDVIAPGLDSPIQAGMQLFATFLREIYHTEDVPVPFEVVYEYDAKLAEGTEWLMQPGTHGSVRREYRLNQVNGATTARQLISETVTPATPQVIAIGTYAAPEAAYEAPVAAVLAPDGAACKSRPTVFATYYTAASAGGNGVTRTGTGVYKGIIAVDPNFIPLGTQMYVPGYGYGVAADTGGGVKGWWIDLGYAANDVFDWGSRTLEVCILS